MQLTRTFTPEQYAKATESWAWLDLADKKPIFTSAFGDVFFTAADGFWWLDTVEGTLTRPWRIADELGGRIDVSNIGVIDFVVGVNITGQLHDQIRGLPPGTKIAGVTISDDGQVRITT